MLCKICEASVTVFTYLLPATNTLSFKWFLFPPYYKPHSHVSAKALTLSVLTPETPSINLTRNVIIL